MSIFTIHCSLVICQTLTSRAALCTGKSSPPEQILQDAKHGVVTVFTSANHGSGFLIDDSGLILTNSHVVKDGEGYLNVKFGDGERVLGGNCGQ